MSKKINIPKFYENNIELNRSRQYGCEKSSQCGEWIGCGAKCEEDQCGKCENDGENPCNYGCMSTCETYCEDVCEDGCERYCEGWCEISCQTVCEDRCEAGCEQSCEGACEKYCQDACEDSCERYCEDSCQDCQRCQSGCQYACEHYCQSDCESCETECLGTCLSACQVCEDMCQTNCEIICESTCLKSCQGCEDGCEDSCQGACLKSCQGCEDSCQNVCLKNCQSCESSNENEPIQTQTNIAERGRTSNSISVRAWYKGSIDARYCQFYCNGKWFATKETSGSHNWTTPSVTKKGLNSGTSYSFYAIFKNGSYHKIGETQTIYISTISPPPSTPSNLHVTNKTKNSISIAWSKSSRATSYNLFLDEKYHGVTSGTTYTFRKLQPLTRYSLGCEAYDSNSNQHSQHASIKTTTLGARPNNWNWSYDIYSGGPVYKTSTSGNTLIAYIMRANEWNNFTCRINEFRDYKGLSKYSFTTVSNDSNCTSSIINQAVNAINDMGFSINRVSHGNVPANVFIQMRKKLNSIS